MLEPFWLHPESRRLAFKEAWPGCDKITRTAVAFAKGAGDRIVFGVRGAPEGPIQVGYLEEKRGRIANQIEQIATEPKYEKSVAHLRAFRGIGTLTALSFVLENGDFRRFTRAEEFMAFLGLIPSENSSGERGCTGTGRVYLGRDGGQDRVEFTMV